MLFTSTVDICIQHLGRVEEMVFAARRTFELHLSSNFVERPWGIATRPQSLFYVSIFLYFVLTDCDQFADFF